MKFTPSKTSVKDLDIYSIIQAFNIPSEVGDQFLNDDSPTKREQFSPCVIKLHLKDESDNIMFDLGKYVYISL